MLFPPRFAGESMRSQALSTLDIFSRQDAGKAAGNLEYLL